MPSLLQCFFLLALVSLVLAVPQPKLGKRSFKVERVANPHFRRALDHKRAPGAGTRALVKAYRKYGMELPRGMVDADGNIPAAVKVAADELVGHPAVEEAKAKAKAKGKANKTKTASSTSTAGATVAAAASTAAASSGSGTVTATPESQDVEYLAPISIGGQSIVMDFDSGSSDLWVFSTQLSATAQKGHTNFDTTKSTTFKTMTGAAFSISYGDGSGAAGTVGTDTVNIGGATVTNQAIEVATAVSSSFVSDTNSNGLVGLAFSKLNTVSPTQQKTFFDNAMSTLSQPVFTADLRKGAVGSYEFGNIDSTKFNGSLSWAAVNTTTGFWQFSNSKFSVGTGATTATDGTQAIADTGTTLMLASSAIVSAYYSQVSGAANDASAGGITFPCTATLPDLNVDVGGNYMALVRGDDINYAPVDSTGTTCFGGLQATTNDPQIWGDIMFKSQFVAFNGGNNSIGMAPHQS
ncbi:aspartyl protease-1 [Coleophoma cylindrospora]|uniref:Aspartyl protease-1 n=1 Tax=Coleophoma cylindrospora TaxID=1849047 RepID=A0A3D8RHX2_9HELO|nr:aspartyl protease-1 [Coleophoma cylindrospora]